MRAWSAGYDDAGRYNDGYTWRGGTRDEGRKRSRAAVTTDFDEKGVMHKSEVLKKIREVGLVPVLRADSEEEALQLAYALEAGGVTVLEVTMTVPGAVDAI